MDDIICYKNVSAYNKTLIQFEKTYNKEKEKILDDIKKILKEKYNIIL